MAQWAWLTTWGHVHWHVLQVSMQDFQAALAEVKPAFGAVTETLDTYRLNGIIDWGEGFRHLSATCRTLVEQVHAASVQLPSANVAMSAAPGSISSFVQACMQRLEECYTRSKAPWLMLFLRQPDKMLPACKQGQLDLPIPPCCSTPFRKDIANVRLLYIGKSSGRSSQTNCVLDAQREQCAAEPSPTGLNSMPQLTGAVQGWPGSNWRSDARGAGAHK